MPKTLTRSDAIAALIAERDELTARRDAVLAVTLGDDARELNDAEVTELDANTTRRNEIGDRLVELAAEAQRDADTAEATRSLGFERGDGGHARVVREAMTYRRGGDHSYFRDLMRSREEGGARRDASERLARHSDEMLIEQRAVMSRTDGVGGEFVPPLWLMDEYLPLAKAGRVFADLCRSLPLPAGTDSINLPKVATGTAVATLADNGAVTETDMTTTSVSGAVTTIAGQQKFAMQLLDQSPMNVDEVVFFDLLAEYAKQLDLGVIAGDGNAPNLSGVAGVSSTAAATYTDASPTVPELFPKLADVIQQIHVGRFLPPQAIVMHPRRWGWILAALDSSNRPLVVPSAQGPQNAFAGFGDVRSEGSVGSILGLPVYVDPNIATNIGAGTNEDRIFVCRFDDLFVFEGALRTRILFETDAGNLQVRLQVWNYAATIPNRYAKSIGIVSGTGLVTPSF